MGLTFFLINTYYYSISLLASIYSYDFWHSFPFCMGEFAAVSISCPGILSPRNKKHGCDEISRIVCGLIGMFMYSPG